MQNAHSASIVGSLGRLLVGVREVIVGERFESDEDAGAPGQGHVANEAGIVGDVDRDGGAPDLVQGPQRVAQSVQVIAP